MKEVINKYKWWVIGAVVALIVLFSARSCNSKKADQIHGENKILKEQVQILKDGLVATEKARFRQKDSIRLENAKAEARIKELKKSAEKSENKVKELQALNTKKKTEIKNLSLQGVAEELNTVYGGKNATATSNSIDIKSSLPYQILETVSDANTASEVIKEKDNQLTIKDSVIVSKDKQIKNSSVLLFSAEKSLNSYKEVNQLQTNLNKNLELENDKLRTKSWWNKVLIPVGIAAGIFAGYQLGSK